MSDAILARRLLSVLIFFVEFYFRWWVHLRKVIDAAFAKSGIYIPARRQSENAGPRPFGFSEMPVCS